MSAVAAFARLRCGAGADPSSFLTLGSRGFRGFFTGLSFSSPSGLGSFGLRVRFLGAAAVVVEAAVGSAECGAATPPPDLAPATRISSAGCNAGRTPEFWFCGESGPGEDNEELDSRSAILHLAVYRRYAAKKCYNATKATARCSDKSRCVPTMNEPKDCCLAAQALNPSSSRNDLGLPDMSQSGAE